jgi:hypothetical protein
MKMNRFAAIAAAALMTAMPAFSASAEEGEAVKAVPVLEDFNKNDVNGTVLVHMPAEAKAHADVTFASPEGGSIAYYSSDLDGSLTYSFDIEGRDNTEEDFRKYQLSISFTGSGSSAPTVPLKLDIEVPDGVENPGTFTVYDYYFVIGENESEDSFVEMKDAPERVKSGDVYKTATYIVYPDHRIKGDVNGDGKITAVDASAVLIEFAELSADGKGTFTPSQFAAADVNNDGKITAVDASSILRYYAALSGNETPEWT